MKKVLVFLLFVSVHHAALAQLFGGEKVTIHGITFKAKEVTSSNRFLGPPDYFRTPIFDPLIPKGSGEYHIDLGSYRQFVGKMEAIPLFNMSLQAKDSPFLDSIDFDYYSSYGFNQTENKSPGLLLDEEYLKFKSYLVDLRPSVKEKKEYLNKAKPIYRNLLLMSRYEIYTNPFTIDKKKISKIASDLRGRLDTLTIKNVEVASNVRAYLSQLADESTVAKGFYVDARLNAFYINKINYYIQTTPRININNDEFAFNLKAYIDSKTAAANTSLVAIQLTGTFDRTKISIDSLSSDLVSKFQVPASDAVKIAASVNVAYSKSEETIFRGAFDNLFIIRYFTSSVIDNLSFPDEKFVSIPQ